MELKNNQDNKPAKAKRTKKSSNYGGVRAGAGRPKGSGNKVSIDSLMEDIEKTIGKSYTEQLASNYSNAINRSDWARVENYDKAFLNKLVSDKSEVTVIEGEEAVEAKKAAFADALKTIAGVKK